MHPVLLDEIRIGIVLQEPGVEALLTQLDLNGWPRVATS